MKRRHLLQAALVSWSVPALPQPALFPARAVRIVVPFPPGGATDQMARSLSQRLHASWKQPVLVDNRAGANGMLGADAVAKSAADGYTLLTATIAHAVNASLFPNAPYKFQSDLQPVAVLGLIPLVAVVRAEGGSASLQELVQRARAGNLNAGSSGNGTAAHLALELFNAAAQVRTRHVPYRGGAPAMNDLLGGQLDVIFSLLPEALPHVRSGRLRALAVTSEQRHPLLAEVPTTAEAGLPQLTVTSWNALMVPAGVPRDLVASIAHEVRRALQEPDVRARLLDQGFHPVAWELDESQRFVSGEVTRWAKLVRDASIQPE